MYGANLGDAITVTPLANKAIAATANETGVDCSQLDGQGAALLVAGAGTGTTPTAALKLQESDTLGGTYTDVVGGAFAGLTTIASVQKLVLNFTDRKPFLRLASTIGGTTPSYPIALVLLAAKKANA